MAELQVARRRSGRRVRMGMVATIAASVMLTGMVRSSGASAGAAADPTRDSAPGIITEPKHEEPVHLDWQEVEREGSTVDLPDGLLTVVARNDLAEPVQVRVGVRLVEGPSATPRDLGAVAVPARGSAAVRVDVTSFGIDYARLAAAANIVGLGQVSTADGRVIARPHTDTLFLAAGSDSLVAYDGEAMREHLGGSPSSPDGPDGADTLAVVDGREGVPVPGLPESGHTHTFCLKYQVDTIDSGFGEDIHADGDVWLLQGNQLYFGLWPAHGAKYQLHEPGVGWGPVSYADVDTGCFSFSSAQTSGFTIRMFGEARLHGNNTLKVEKRLPDYSVVSVSWDIKADPGPGGTRVYFVPGGPESSFIGIASSVVHRVNPLTAAVLGEDQLEEVPFSGQHLKLRLVPDGPSICGSEGGACYGGDIIYSSKLETSEKFVVGHEVGHWMHDHWESADVSLPGSYAYDDEHPACAFVGVGAHAMRSREVAARAFAEGVAHFVSALAWNDLTGSDGVFKYYKTTDDPNMELYDNDLIDVAANGPEPQGGIVNWNDNKCGAETSPFVGHSVEQDWLRFLWDYATARGPRPTLNELITQIGAVTSVLGLNPTNVANKFRDTLVDTPYHDRWIQLAELHGVDSST